MDDARAVLLALTAAGIHAPADDVAALAEGLPALRRQVALLWSGELGSLDEEPATAFLTSAPPAISSDPPKGP